MPFRYVVNVYSDMSMSKRHLGSRGGGSKNKLKETKLNVVVHYFYRVYLNYKTFQIVSIINAYSSLYAKLRV